MANSIFQWTVQSNSDQETYGLGRQLGSIIPASTVLGLNGTLGSGKTKLMQGIVAGILNSQEVVVSPTFTLCIPYEGRISLWHLDAYRIQDDEEVFELGLDEAVDDGCAIAVEWVDKIRELIPPLDVVVELQHQSPMQRQLDFQAFTSKGETFLRASQKIAGQGSGAIENQS